MGESEKLQKTRKQTLSRSVEAEIERMVQRHQEVERRAYELAKERRAGVDVHADDMRAERLKLRDTLEKATQMTSDASRARKEFMNKASKAGAAAGGGAAGRKRMQELYSVDGKKENRFSKKRMDAMRDIWEQDEVDDDNDDEFGTGEE